MNDLRQRKIGRDLRRHWRQSLLAMIAIASSVSVLTTLLATRALLVDNLKLAMAAAPAPDALYRVTALPPALLAQVQGLPGIIHAGATRIESFRVQYGDEIWSELRLEARSDLESSARGLVLEDGVWPGAAPVTIALELSSTDVTAATTGSTVRLFQGELGEMAVRVASVIYDPTATPSRFLSNLLRGFASLEGLAELTGRRGYDWLYVVLSPDLAAADRAQTLAAVESMFVSVGVAYEQRTPEPASGTLVRFVETTIFVLAVLAVFGSLLGVAWTSNVMTTILAREQVQVGVLKTLGFVRSQIVLLYLGQALLLGALASLAALPLSYAAALLAAHLVAAHLLAKQIVQIGLDPAVFAPGLLLGLAVPLFGALVPVWRGATVPVRQALDQTPGSGARFRQAGWLPGLHLISPLTLYVGRNLLRHRSRAAFSLVVLALAGATFITVTTLNDSLDRTLQRMMNYWLADVRFETSAPVGTYLVRNEVLALPGVADLEARLLLPGARRRQDGSASPEINLVGLPPASPFLQPTLVAGRWLREDDLNAVVIDTELLRLEPELQVGDEVVLEVEASAQSWQVVGIAAAQLLGYSLTDTAVAYAPYRYLSESVGRSGQANFFLIATKNHDPAAQRAAAVSIEDSLHYYRFSPAVMEPNTTRLHTAQQVFTLITRIVLAMSLLFAFAGGLSLLNLANLNVLERRYEIAVIRAMGGDRRTLLGLVAGEALLLALAGAALAALVALPLSILLCRLTGLLLINMPLYYGYSWGGVVAWLLMSVVFSAVSALLPLHRQAAAPVQEGLRHV